MINGFHPKMSSLKTKAGAYVLAISVLLGAWALPGDAAIMGQDQAAQTVSTRFEGFLKALGSGKWLVGETSVLVDDRTTVSEKRGRAEPGAWVIVWGERDPYGSVRAALIQIDRPAGRSGPVIQFSGVLHKQAGAWWVIDDALVQVTPDIAQITGEPRIGALLWVVAENQDTSYRALAIEVLAQTSDTRPVEFEGPIETLGTSEWTVAGHRLVLGSDSVIIGEPAIGAVAEVRAAARSDGAWNVLLARIVDEPPPEELGALILGIAPDEGGGVERWTLLVFPPDPWVDPVTGFLDLDTTTFVDESRALARPGQWLQARGTRTGPGGFRADSIRIEQPTPVDLTAGLQLAGAPGSAWRQFRGQPVWLAAAPQAAAAAISAEGPARGLRLGNGVIIAAADARARDATSDDDSSPWSAPVAIAAHLKHAARPALAYTPDHVAHALWETHGQLFYASQPPNAAWSAPVRIAAGTSPVIAVDSAGRLQAVFSNQFLGGYEIYHTIYQGGKWTLPMNISNTAGASFAPALAAGPDGALHAAWMDNSPGYWTLYIGSKDGAFWTNYPIPNARGQAPALTCAADGNLLVAWQERVPTIDNPTGNYAIYFSELTDPDRWSMPVKVSDQPGKDALGPDLAFTEDGFAQLVWVEADQDVRYCFGRGFYWPPSNSIHRTPLAAHGPHITVAHGVLLYIAWDEGDMVRAVSSAPAPGQWPAPTTVAESDAGVLRDVALTPMPDGGVAVQWVQVSQANAASIYTSWQASEFRRRCWLPIALYD